MRGRLYSGSDFDDNRSHMSKGLDDNYMEATSPAFRTSSVSGDSSKKKAFKMNLISKLGGNRDEETNDDGFDLLSELDEHYHQKAKIILK